MKNIVPVPFSSPLSLPYEPVLRFRLAFCNDLQTTLAETGFVEQERIEEVHELLQKKLICLVFDRGWIDPLVAANAACNHVPPPSMVDLVEVVGLPHCAALAV